jgi:3-deoxy-D-manno-octulosonate 8-phosphate phosphatase (KDO 8-P phosphatase)
MTLAQRCLRVELLVLDVDGVLTDGRVIYAGAETEVKAFHVRDGSALVWWHRAGKRTAVVSGRDSPAVARRAAELGVQWVAQGAADKRAALQSILEASGLGPQQVAAMGDDLPDLPVLSQAGLAVAVADACPELREVAHHVTRVPGGHGAVREVVELILRCQGSWQRVVEGYSLARSP